MRRSHLVVSVAVLAACLALIRVDAAPPQRIIAVGDVHGAADAFAAILQRAGLIDAQRRWTGGSAVLVQTGDVTDRGTGVRAVLDLLMALEPQAAKAGGRVQAVLGNHELMNLLGDTRDVAPELLKDFTDAESEERRERAYQAEGKLRRGAPPDKAAWLAKHPLGYVEYRDALRPNGTYGKWLRSKPVLAEINGSVFMHGGINPEFTTDSLDSINRRARRELSGWDNGLRWLQQHDLASPISTLADVVEATQRELAQLENKRKQEPLTEDDLRAARLLLPLLAIGSSSLLSPEGPVWFRGYASWSNEEGSERMAALLRKYRVKRFVTGHTPQQTGRITSRFDGGLFLIDTGMLNGRFYPSGRPSALEIVGETVTPLYLEQ